MENVLKRMWKMKDILAIFEIFGLYFYRKINSWSEFIQKKSKIKFQIFLCLEAVDFLPRFANLGGWVSVSITQFVCNENLLSLTLILPIRYGVESVEYFATVPNAKITFRHQDRESYYRGRLRNLVCRFVWAFY